MLIADINPADQSNVGRLSVMIWAGVAIFEKFVVKISRAPSTSARLGIVTVQKLRRGIPCTLFKRFRPRSLPERRAEGVEWQLVIKIITKVLPVPL